MVAKLSELDHRELEAFCRRWNIAVLEAFGSVLRDDFGPESDVDLIATFASGSRWSLLDRVRMKQELEDLLGRDVDLLNRKTLLRHIEDSRTQHILSTARVCYERT